MKKEDEAREAQRRYVREWRKSHPERVREYNLRYWAKRAEREKRELEKDGNG